ncbi:MFS transporter [Candidatus Bathyarchaeota archaeon]|nr:MAG: MFS transporter [Candidatus Bathyarchaeota archaeon]
MEPAAQEKRGFFSKIPGKLKWLIVALVFNNIAIGYLLVYLTGFFPELNISAGIVGLLLGLEGAMVLLSIPLGIFSDRKGRKKLLLIGSALVPPPIIMIALFTLNIALLVVAAIILGIAESAALSTWNAIIADQTNLENRDVAFSLSFILGNGGVAFGFLLPTFIPAIQSLTGLDSITVHRDLLVLVGLVSAITPVWLLQILKGYKETLNPTKLIRGKNFPILLKFSGINSLIGLGAGFIIPLIPTWLFLKFGTPDTFSGPLLSLSNLTIALAAIGSPRLSSKFGLLKAIVATQGFSTVFMLSLAFVPDVRLAGGLYIIRAALMNMAGPLGDSYLMGIMSQDERGLASAINTVVWRIPNSITTVIGGLILATGRFDIPFYLATIFYAISITLFYTQFKNIRPQS